VSPKGGPPQETFVCSPPCTGCCTGECVLQNGLQCSLLTCGNHESRALLTSMHRQSSGFFCSPQRPLQGQVPLQQMYLQMPPHNEVFNYKVLAAVRTRAGVYCLICVGTMCMTGPDIKGADTARSFRRQRICEGHRQARLVSAVPSAISYLANR
jgi:hypothetical protein